MSATFFEPVAGAPAAADPGLAAVAQMAALRRRQRAAAPAEASTAIPAPQTGATLFSSVSGGAASEPAARAPLAQPRNGAPLASDPLFGSLREAMAIAGLPGSSTVVVGPRPAEQRSIWGHLRRAASVAAVALSVTAGAWMAGHAAQQALGHADGQPRPAAATASAPSWAKVGQPSAALAPSASAANTAASPSAAAPGSRANNLAPMGYGGSTPAAQAPAADGLVALPIQIDDENPLSEQELAEALLPHDSFLATAVTVERLRLSVYFDPNANIGMGYCIPRRVAEYGKAHVREDFLRAGIEAKEADALLSGSRKRLKDVHITQSQALRLLIITKADYESIARNTVGDKAFGALSPERRDMLTYLAYNSSLRNFGNMANAVRRGQDHQAMAEMVPAFHDAAGAMQMNYRLASYLWSGWMGKLADAIHDPMRHEGLYANADGLASMERAYGFTGAKTKAARAHHAHAAPAKALPAQNAAPALSAADGHSLRAAHAQPPALNPQALRARLSGQRQQQSAAAAAAPAPTALERANANLSF
jgi:hypothetical protein